MKTATAPQMPMTSFLSVYANITVAMNTYGSVTTRKLD